MAKTTTITREYDREGRVVKETIVESGEANAFDGPVWISPPQTGTNTPLYPGLYQPYAPPYTVTC